MPCPGHMHRQQMNCDSMDRSRNHFQTMLSVTLLFPVVTSIDMWQKVRTSCYRTRSACMLSWQVDITIDGLACRWACVQFLVGSKRAFECHLRCRGIGRSNQHSSRTFGGHAVLTIQPRCKQHRHFYSPAMVHCVHMHVRQLRRNALSSCNVWKANIHGTYRIPGSMWRRCGGHRQHKAFTSSPHQQVLLHDPLCGNRAV
jgi:hypothetical protein